VTTIAVRDGIVAADSWETHWSEEGGACRHTCTKLFRKRVVEGRRAHDVIIATAGSTSPGMIFVDWYGSGKEIPRVLLDRESDFLCLVLTPKGLFEVDEYFRPVQILEPFYSIGSGSKAALAAMHCGRSAVEAVRIAARIDPYTGGRVISMKLDDQPARARKKA
jgi:hypothetical protein